MVASGLRFNRDGVSRRKMVEAAGIEPASGCQSSGPSTWVVVLFSSRRLTARQPAAPSPNPYWFSSVAAEVTLIDQPASDVRPKLAGSAPETGYLSLGSQLHAVVGIYLWCEVFKGASSQPLHASVRHT